MASSRCSRSSITRRSEREGAKLASGSAHRRREPFVFIQLRRTPFDWIDEGVQPRIFWILTALVVGLSLVLGERASVHFNSTQRNRMYAACD